jgi:hypothetical protein
MAAWNSVVDVAMNAQGVELERRCGRPLLSGMHAGHSFGLVAGSFAGTLAAAAAVPVRLHFALTAAAAIAAAVPATRRLVPERRTARERRFAWPRGRLALLGLVAFCGFLLDGSADTWVAVQLRTERGTGPALAAAAFLVYALPLAAARLAGAPWYLQRNLLIVIDGLPAWPEGFSPAPFARHEDVRVRREAMRMMLKAPATRVEAIPPALEDPDAAIVHLALGAALGQCPPAAVPLVVRHAGDREAEPHIRALAIRVLAGVRSPDAVEALLALTLGKKTLLGRRRLAPRSPELLAALAGLAAHWQSDPRARTVLALAQRSGDPEVRAAAEGKRR